jgi:hypothetical protein
MTDQDDLVPSSKFDVEAARRAVEAGWPAVEPIFPELLAWVEDYNWPVARVLAPFIADIGTPVVPYLRPILDGDDAIRQYWILTTVLSHATAPVIAELRLQIERLACDTSATLSDEGVPEAARAVLARRTD